MQGSTWGIPRLSGERAAQVTVCRTGSVHRKRRYHNDVLAITSLVPELGEASQPRVVTPVLSPTRLQHSQPWQQKCCETSSLLLSLGSRLPELLAQHALERLPRGIPRNSCGE